MLVPNTISLKAHHMNECLLTICKTFLLQLLQRKIFAPFDYDSKCVTIVPKNIHAIFQTCCPTKNSANIRMNPLKRRIYRKLCAERKLLYKVGFQFTVMTKRAQQQLVKFTTITVSNFMTMTVPQHEIGIFYVSLIPFRRRRRE